MFGVLGTCKGAKHEAWKGIQRGHSKGTGYVFCVLRAFNEISTKRKKLDDSVGGVPAAGDGCN
eukprot:1150799-Pelagomonas_calceolata.AAC.9